MWKNSFIRTLAFATILGVALSAVAVDLDRDGIADVILPTTSVATVVEPAFGWRDEWAVRPGWRGAHDWNGDGIIDWRDDFIVGGVRPWSGDYIRADWNGDGVIDWQDGWRRLDTTWATGAWDPTWRGEGWRPETVSVREVPAGFYQDTEWSTFDGPWDTFGWGGAVVADWNRDGVIDWRDDLAWRTPVVSAPVVSAPVVSAPVAVDWNRDGVIDWRDGWGGPTLVNVREVPAGSARAATTSTTKPTATKTTTKPAAAKTTTKPAAAKTTTAAKPAATKPAATTKPTTRR